ncbi:MAG: RNA polymerase sigma factor [Candidatus Aminicenantes bacterium]|jgi:RNA polymerase sigma-70 factor (ECF subfamily)
MLVNAYSKRVFNMAYQFAGSYEEAEDLTQEIFFKLYNSLSKYDFTKNFSAWLLTMSKNYLIDQYRKTKWEKKTRDDFNEHCLAASEMENPEYSAVLEENKKLVWQGFNHLSSDLRVAVILRDIQGKSYDEIAEVLELPLGTVKSRVNRGRLQLAKVLKQKKEKGEHDGM